MIASKAAAAHASTPLDFITGIGRLERTNAAVLLFVLSPVQPITLAAAVVFGGVWWVVKDPIKLEYYKRDLELRIAELDHSIAAAEQEARALATKPADVLDQAALEQDKQLVLRKIAADQQLRTNLMQTLERIRKGHFGELVALLSVLSIEGATSRGCHTFQFWER